MTKLLLLLVVLSALLSSRLAQAQASPPDAQLLALLRAFAQTSAVTGREEEAQVFLESLFQAHPLQRDKLGNLFLVLGQGTPRRLLTAPLDEPGYVISQIQSNGYLRLTPVGGGQAGTLFHQFIEGHDVRIHTAQGARNGISCVPSSHYDNLRAVPEKSKPPFAWQDAFIDVGASSATAVASQGIRLLDPLTLYKKPVVLPGPWVAAPAMKTKAAAVALAVVAQTLAAKPIQGTVVLAWTALELLNGKGYEAIANQHGPFDEVYRFNRFLESAAAGKGQVLADQALPRPVPAVLLAKPQRGFRAPVLPNSKLVGARVYQLGLPATYPNTPVEAVALADVKQLAQVWLQSIDSQANTLSIPPLPQATPASSKTPVTGATAQLAGLVSRYGVSTAEQPVREYIARQLPAWAKPTVDAQGNLVVSFGQGKTHLVFVAHMDEVGFVVDSIRPNGRLVLGTKGGFFDWLWEAQAAVVHLPGHAELPAVFEPRPNYLQATKSTMPGPVTANAGFASAQEARAAGVQPGLTTVTMPKQLLPLSAERAAARGFDDRVGCAVLLRTLQHLNPAALPCRVTYVWSVGEETGLVGAAFAAQSLQDATVVYPIDTFVSSDAPQESRAFGYCPLGQGAVIRVLESINFVNRDLTRYVTELAARNHIPLQAGMTAGGTDGQEFLNYGIPSVPLSWPGRYSHSPVEVLDYRDMNSLTQLIETLIKDKKPPY
ncbi:M28 family peptidase [Hymenobacter sp. BT491]|uniref:M28 family peptidase n=1 Tax=Hymenobacter sp. BT491 TaxID=2766779 RepID=UPI001653D8F9|nr:M28 family peptidase [Hymenobacter sp. BT491]MBC6992349.1 M28 family peptidase [Hymenobacter sp. BT491]